jgi:hypothetical protein
MGRLLYSSAIIVREIKSKRVKWSGHVTRKRKMRNIYKIMYGRPEGKRRLWKLEYNIKVDVKGMECDVWTVMNWLRIWSNGRCL